MVKLFLLLVIGVFLAENIQARDVNGKFIMNNDTFEVIVKIPTKYFLYPDFYSIQKEIKYYYETKEVKKINPDQLKEFIFYWDTLEYKMQSCVNNIGVITKSSNIFLKVVKEGKLNLYEYYYKALDIGPNSSIVDTESRFAIKKEGGEVRIVPKSEFKKEMNEYLSECPNLIEKINNYDLRKKDIYQIVEYYNNECN